MSDLVTTPEDIRQLQATRILDGIELRWLWPRGCKLVDVGWRTTVPPNGPNDENATWTSVSRGDYRNAGGRWVIDLGADQPSQRLGVMIIAKFSEGDHWRPAAADPANCVTTADWKPWTSLTYRIEPDSQHKGKLKLSWRVRHPAERGFTGFTLSANDKAVPQPGDDDVFELYTWRAPGGLDEREHHDTIDLREIHQRGWERFYVRAHPIDPAESSKVLIVHPDTCQAFRHDGRRLSEPSLNGQAGYRQGAPEEIVCPSCLRAFPTQQLLFLPGTSQLGQQRAEPQTGKRGLLAKMRNQPPKPPKDEFGRQFSRRICPLPDCGRELPVTAGSQPNLIIGLVGAKFSGKTHYITSLIHRLGEIAVDFDASLVHQGDATQDRYEDMREQLFDLREELAVTTGTPPPLVYDLQIGGSLWNTPLDRSATLALYDTAGENLDSATEAERMVQYLRVASGLIFLIDPLQIQRVRERIPNPPTIAGGDIGFTDPQVIIGNVLDLLEKNGALNAGERLQLPVAVVLAKSDALRDQGLMPETRIWNSKRGHRLALDQTLTNDISGMFGEFLQRYAPDAYATITQRFPNHAFFGVSATGCAPDEDGFPFIAPWRVEDPLLWLLGQLQLIPVRDEL